MTQDFLLLSFKNLLKPFTNSLGGWCWLTVNAWLINLWSSYFNVIFVGCIRFYLEQRKWFVSFLFFLLIAFYFLFPRPEPCFPFSEFLLHGCVATMFTLWQDSFVDPHHCYLYLILTISFYNVQNPAGVLRGENTSPNVTRRGFLPIGRAFPPWGKIYTLGYSSFSGIFVS